MARHYTDADIPRELTRLDLYAVGESRLDEIKALTRRLEASEREMTRLSGLLRGARQAMRALKRRYAKATAPEQGDLRLPGAA